MLQQTPAMGVRRFDAILKFAIQHLSSVGKKVFYNSDRVRISLLPARQ